MQWTHSLCRRDRGIGVGIPLIVDWRGNCRVCVAFLVSGSPKYNFYFRWSVWKRSSKYFPDLSFWIPWALLLRRKEGVEVDSHLWPFPSSEDNIGVHWNFPNHLLWNFQPFYFEMFSKKIISQHIVSWMCLCKSAYMCFVFKTSIKMQMFTYFWTVYCQYQLWWHFWLIGVFLQSISEKVFLYSVSFRRNNFFF